MIIVIGLMVGLMLASVISVAGEIKRENRRWNDIKRRHRKW